MNTASMRILLPARHGLGDVLHGYFIAERGRTVLARVRYGLATGRIASAMLVYEHCYNPSIGELFRALPFDLLVKTTGELPEVANCDADNRMPHAVRWHQNVYTNPPSGFEELDCTNSVECPSRRPPIDLPKDFILFSDGASATDRVLADPEIYSFLRTVTGLPVVKVGKGYDVVPADINLCNRLNIVETLDLAKRARLVVAPLTMFRTFSALFGTPVIELTERPSAGTIDRTRLEYAKRLYGMNPELNEWYVWPAQRDQVRSAIVRRMGLRHG